MKRKTRTQPEGGPPDESSLFHQLALLGIGLHDDPDAFLTDLVFDAWVKLRSCEKVSKLLKRSLYETRRLLRRGEARARAGVRLPEDPILANRVLVSRFGLAKRVALSAWLRSPAGSCSQGTYWLRYLSAFCQEANLLGAGPEEPLHFNVR